MPDKTVLLLLLLLVTAGGGQVEGQTLKVVEFVPGEKAKLEIFAAERGKPITRYLFGKFTEHLGRNVYGGLWAQILLNPGFESEEYFTWGNQSVAETLAHRAGWLGLPPELHRQISQRLADSFQNGVAYGWAQHGEGDVSYARDTERINSATSQKMEVHSLSSSEVGILQPLCLPLHREKRFDLSVWAKGSGKSLRVTVRTADEKRVLATGVIESLTDEWKKHALRLTVNAVGIQRGEPLLLTIGLTAPGTVWLDQCFLFPADNMKGFDADVVRYCREMKLPLLRFPGGNFVSGYHWEEGVGSVDERPMRRNPAWPGTPEYNHVGTDEMMAFCEAVGCEPLICINAGNGTPEEAARWVEYCNGSVNTPQGRRRAANGHPKPYNVKLWEIGNELWGNWQIGHCTAEEYAERYRKFYHAMKAVDPTIHIIACGQDARWNAPMIEKNADILRSLSIHTLIAHGVPRDANPEEVYRSLAAFPVWYESHLTALGKQMAQKVTPPRIAITELQIMTPSRPNNHTLTEALYLAGIINTSIRLGDLVEMITHSALVNHAGGLGKGREFVWQHPVNLTSRLYSTQSGRIPVRLRVTSPTFSVPRFHDLPAVQNAPYLDAVALLNDGGNELTLLVTNRHPSETLTAEITWHDFALHADVTTHTIMGADFLSVNSFEQPDAVRLAQGKTKAERTGLTYSFPPHSVTALVLRRKQR